MLNKFFREGLWALFFEGVKPAIAAISPPLLGILTAVTAWKEGLPWTYVIVSGAVVFAMIAVGLLRFSDWVQKITAKTNWLSKA